MYVHIDIPCSHVRFASLVKFCTRTRYVSSHNKLSTRFPWWLGGCLRCFGLLPLLEPAGLQLSSSSSPSSSKASSDDAGRDDDVQLEDSDDHNESDGQDHEDQEEEEATPTPSASPSPPTASIWDGSGRYTLDIRTTVWLYLGYVRCSLHVHA